MATKRSPQRSARRQRGFSLIEIMIGIVIGMIAVLVIYQIFAAAEGIKRNTTGVGDAQQNGLLSSFMLSIELANASNGVAVAAKDLQTCPFTTDPATTFRPIPILITDGGANSDQFVVNYSVSNSGIVLAPIKSSPDATHYVVQSPFGFRKGDIVVAISEGGACGASKVTTDPVPTAACAFPGPDPVPSACGQMTLTLSAPGVPPTGGGYMVNMGQSGQQRVLYDVTNGVLRSTSLWDASGQPVAQAPNPIASNVVAMKLQYGVLVGGVFSWVSANAAPWDAASVLAADLATLKQIQSVRIGIVVQGEQYDKTLPASTWSLFCNPGPCVTGPLNAGFRYRTYETAIPLRNPVWNIAS